MGSLSKQDHHVEAFPLLLRCPDIHHASHVVTAVVEDALIELLMDCDGHDDWFDEGWYWGHLKDRLYDHRGNITFAAHGEELWDFMMDPEAGFMNMCRQIDDLVGSFYKLNEDKLNEVYNGYDIKSVKVIRAFRNQWLMLVQGVKHESDPKRFRPHSKHPAVQ